MKRFLKSSAFFAFVLTVVMLVCTMTAFAADNYVLYLGDRQVTSANAHDIFGDGTAAYDEETATLTLNGAVVNTYSEFTRKMYNNKEVTFKAMLFTEQSLTIKVNGSCSFDNSRVAEDEGFENSYGIVAYGSDDNYPDVRFEGNIKKSDKLNIYTHEAENDVTGILAWNANLYFDRVDVYSSCYAYNKYPVRSFGIRAVSNADLLGDLDEYDSGSIYISASNVGANACDTKSNEEYKESPISTGITCYALEVDNSSEVKAWAGSVYSVNDSAYSSGLEVGRRFYLSGQSSIFASSSNASVTGNDGEEHSISSYGFITGAENVYIDELSTLSVSTKSVSSDDEADTQLVVAVVLLLGDLNIDGASSVDVEILDVAKTTTLGVAANDIKVGKGKISILSYDDVENSDNYAAITATNLSTVYDAYDGNGSLLVYDEESKTYVNSDGTAPKKAVISVGMPEDAPSYILYVGGVQVNDFNKDDVFGDGTVSYDPETATLTLNNANITGCYYSNSSFESYATGIFYGQSLNIVVSGECTVYTDAEGANIVTAVSNNNDYKYTTLTITGDGDETEDVLRLFADGGISECHGIFAESGDLVIKDVTVFSTGGSSDTSNGIKCSSWSTVEGGELVYKCGGTVTFENAEVNAYGGDVSNASGTSSGIFTSRLYLSGNTVLKAYGGEIEGYNGITSTGILVLTELTASDETVVYAYGNNVHMTENSEKESTAVSAGILAALGSIAVEDNAKIYAYGGTSSADNVNDQAVSMGVLGVAGITTDDSAYVYGKGGDAGYVSIGVLAGVAVVSGKSSVCGEIDTDCDAQEKIGVLVATEMENSSVKDSKTGEILRVSDTGYVNSSGKYPEKAVVVPGKLSAYNIWVGGVQVNAENCNDVFGDGTVSFNPETGILTLDNADISGYVEIDGVGTAAIYTDVPLAIEVKGTNSIETGSEGSYADAGIFYAGEDITGESAIIIYGDSTSDVLNVSAADAVSANAVIASASGNIVFRDVTVNAVGGTTGSDAYGIAAGTNTIGDIVVDGAIVNVDAGDVVASDDVYQGTALGAVANNIDITNHGQLNIIGGDVTAPNGGTSVGAQVVGSINVSGESKLSGEGGNVTETSGESDGTSTSVGVVAENLNVGADSSVSGTGNNTTGTSVGVYGKEMNVEGTVSGKTTSDENVFSAGIVTGSDISNGKITDADSGKELTYNSSYETFLDENGVPGKNVVIRGGIVLGDYNLFVGHVLVTAQNKDDIFGEEDEGATAYYDPDTNTLYFNNANVTTCFGDSDIIAGVARLGSLNIELIGDNKITVSADEYNYDTVFGLAAAGKLNITSDDYATLEVVVNTASSLINAGIATLDINSQGVGLDMTVSGKAIVSAKAGNITYYSSAPSVGILSGSSISILDDASLYGYGGETVIADEGSSEGVTVSAGIMTTTDLIVNTSGKVYGKGADSDATSTGVGVYGKLNLVRGVVYGDATSEMTYGGLAGGVAFVSEPQNVVAYTGVSKDNLDAQTYWGYDQSLGLGTYVDSSYQIGLYTMLLPGQGMNVLETENTDDDEDDDIISVYVTGYDNVIVAFASYDVNGRMIDMRYTLSEYADDFGKVTCNNLDMNGAVRVKSFVFGTDMTLAPLCQELERFI